MSGLLQAVHSSLRNLAAVVLLATVAYIPTPTPTPDLRPTSTPLLIPTQTRTPTPGPTIPVSSTPTPGRPTSTPTIGPSATPTPMVPTSTPTRTPTAGPILTSTPTSSPVTIRSIQMVDTTTGWAEGYVGSGDSIHILRTADGATTWRDVTPLQLDSHGFEAFFLDAQLAWAWDSEAGAMWRTQDGGRSWSHVGDSTWPDTIWFNDSQHGWKVNGEAHGMSFPGYDIHSFATTQDGGQTWEEKNPPPGGGFPFLAFPDERTAWLVRASYRVAMPGWADLGVPIRVHMTFDGGSTWQSRRLPLPAGTYTFHDRFDMGSYLGGVGNCGFVSPVYSSPAIWKLVLTCEEGSWMYTSANQGKTWIISPLPPGGRAMELEFISPTIGWLLQRDRLDRSQSRLYTTTNGGQSWNLIKRTGWMNAWLEFVDEDTGWAVACAEWHCYQYDAVRALVKTTDGGRTWRIIEPELAP